MMGLFRSGKAFDAEKDIADFAGTGKAIFVTGDFFLHEKQRASKCWLTC
jgi:hypothetical protein